MRETEVSTKWYSVHRSPSPRFWFILSLPSLSSFCDFSRMSVSVAILASASSSFSSRSVKVTSLLADLSVSREPPSTSATHHTGPRASRRRRLVLVLLAVRRSEPSSEAPLPPPESVRRWAPRWIGRAVAWQLVPCFPGRMGLS